MGFTSVHSAYADTADYERPAQLTIQQLEDAFAKADAEYQKSGSAEPYVVFQKKIEITWDVKDKEYGKVIYGYLKKAHEKEQQAKREHPIRNSKLLQIFHGERALVPHM